MPDPCNRKSLFRRKKIDERHLGVLLPSITRRDDKITTEKRFRYDKITTEKRFRYDKITRRDDKITTGETTR